MGTLLASTVIPLKRYLGEHLLCTQKCVSHFPDLRVKPLSACMLSGVSDVAVVVEGKLCAMSLFCNAVITEKMHYIAVFFPLMVNLISPSGKCDSFEYGLAM